MSKFTLIKYDNHYGRFIELCSFVDLTRAIKRFIELRNNHNEAQIKGDGISLIQGNWSDEDAVLIYEIITEQGTKYREIHDLQTGQLVQIKAETRTEVEKREDLMMPFDPEVPVTIGCPDHGDFYITPNDHTGKNPERIAYGCPDCNADVDLSEVEKKQPKYNELKAEEWEDTNAD